VVYSATKRAVDAMTLALALELRTPNIRVNAIAPGGTTSEGGEDWILGSPFRRR